VHTDVPEKYFFHLQGWIKSIVKWVIYVRSGFLICLLKSKTVTELGATGGNLRISKFLNKSVSNWEPLSLFSLIHSTRFLCRLDFVSGISITSRNKIKEAKCAHFLGKVCVHIFGITLYFIANISKKARNKICFKCDYPIDNLKKFFAMTICSSGLCHHLDSSVDTNFQIKFLPPSSRLKTLSKHCCLASSSQGVPAHNIDIFSDERTSRSVRNNL
jgi:hypothetical protein